MTDYRLAFDPLLPWSALAALALVALAVIAYAFWTRPRSAWLRALALALGFGALADPSIVREDRRGLSDVVAIVLDRSASQSIEQRRAQTDRARVELEKSLAALGNVETRVIEAGGDGDADGTRLFGALAGGLADVPHERVGGVFIVSDGVVHDAPANAASLGFRAPVHTLVTGRADERDRRVELVEAPRFGIVGKEIAVGVRVLESGRAGGETVTVAIRRDGEPIGTRTARIGDRLRIPVKIEHAGPNVIEIEVAALADELTAINNKAVLTVEGVRDKLKVLLVSGEPHAGERMWRNLLKSDANVDLVHFTILRPPEKQDGTPISELSLIAFPTADLFGRKIGEFDLIIFDRYSNQSILPTIYFDNIVRYVREGGALLIAAGPDFSSPRGLYYSPLGAISPAKPLGDLVERPFRAAVTEAGQRHPVTRGLPGADADPPRWSEWYRLISAEPTRAASPILAGPDRKPLLVLARERKGRVALLLSDQMWLWARAHQEGGPHLDLLRRLAHWLMKEPDLEEEALRARARGREIAIERQSVKEPAREVTVTSPTGGETKVTLAAAEPGLARGRLMARELGLHKVSDGELTVLANVGPDNPREFQEVVSTFDRLQPLADATGGTVRRIGAGGDQVTMPRLAAMRAAPTFGGADYVAIRRTESSVVTGVGVLPLGVGFLGLLMLLGAVVAAWLWESRRKKAG
ncbi:MAG: hypothetical protein JNK46_19220 [Methylobacteriaceae bacterium]|nr:hypothetical protein [Methylobacteriaceae bacterium]